MFGHITSTFLILHKNLNSPLQILSKHHMYKNFLEVTSRSLASYRWMFTVAQRDQHTNDKIVRSFLGM